jgi:type III secretion protein V
LIVYLLDPEIERMLSPHPVLGTGEQRRTELAESARDKILEALRDEVGAYPLSASAPVILTTIDVRPALRDLIAHEFPRLPVLAYQELSPEMNIQPIARISLNT